MSGQQARALRMPSLRCSSSAASSISSIAALSRSPTQPCAQACIFSATQIGALLSAFSLAYGFAQIPAGWLLDRVGPRSVLSAGMLLWSVAQTATGMVSSFAALVATRIGLGIGEAPFLPGGVKVIRDWYDAPERGLPMGILNCFNDTRTSLRAAAAHGSVAQLRLAQHVRLDRPARRCRRRRMVSPLPGAARKQRNAGEHLSRHMEAALSPSHHVGHDARLQRRQLHGVALSRMAAWISGSRASPEPRENRLARGHSLPDGLNWDARQWSRSRQARAARR